MPACLREECAHGFSLVVAVLQQQPATGLEVGRGLFDQGADVVQAVIAAGQRLQGFVRERGQDAIYRSIEERKTCCDIRKLEPLKRALQGQRAWITGLRREQSANRGAVDLIDKSELTTQGRIKLNPLAEWTWGDVWHYIATEGVDYNPLHDEFFPSIGCAPCTRAISLGEEFRAGRWWWEDEAAKECGLHVKS